MTAGGGICHSEVSTRETTVLHGVQLWLALPDVVRDTLPRRFEHYEPEPVVFDGGSALVFLGELLGAASPVAAHSPLVGAEIRLDPAATLDLPIDPLFEHGVLVDAVDLTVEGVSVPRATIGYTGIGSERLRLRNEGTTPARAVLIGGAPFGEDIIMWWNFVGRDSDEIARYRQEW